MGNLEIATIFIVLANILMWFSQIAMLSVNPLGTTCYHPEGSVIGQTVTNGTINNNIVDQLPDPIQTQGGSGGFVLDLFNSILSFMKSIPGVHYIVDVAAAPYNILKVMNCSIGIIPEEFIVGIGTLWYLITGLVIFSYIFWR